AGQHHHHCAAAKMPRTQPCRKRLAIHARQLALKSRLRILRRSRRALLRGLEQARRSALAHHVHRIASMGARVLINGTWYKGCLPGLCRSMHLDVDYVTKINYKSVLVDSVSGPRGAQGAGKRWGE